MTHRTISRMVTNAYPAWRSAMTQTDRLYYVGVQQPSHAPALVGVPSHYGVTSTMPDDFGAGWDVMTGYSSGTWLADVGGTFGTMVYGTGGHTRLQNQVLAFNISEDSPTFSWWHPPTWVTSDSADANIYYSPSEAAALIAGPRGTAARIRGSNEAADAAAWDRQFPVTFDDWIIPRKMTTGQMGNNVPHGFRYSTTQYIPASVTGTDPMYMAINGAQGPFVQSYAPSNVTDSEWFNASALGNASARRWPYYFRNCRTGAWTMHQWHPDKIRLNNFGGARIGWFSDIKRVYVNAPFVDSGQGFSGWYYLDFSAGFANHTVSAVTYAGVGMQSFAGAAFSEGDALGRHFAVSLGSPSTTGVTVANFDTNPISFFAVDLSAFGFSFVSSYEKVGVSWDAANRRVLYVTQSRVNSQLEYWSIGVPDVLTNTAGWTAVKRVPALDDPAMATSHFSDWQDFSTGPTGFYGKTRYLPSLGVVLVPCGRRRQLALRPR